MAWAPSGQSGPDHHQDQRHHHHQQATSNGRHYAAAAATPSHHHRHRLPTKDSTSMASAAQIQYCMACIPWLPSPGEPKLAAKANTAATRPAQARTASASAIRPQGRSRVAGSHSSEQSVEQGAKPQRQQDDRQPGGHLATVQAPGQYGGSDASHGADQLCNQQRNEVHAQIERAAAITGGRTDAAPISTRPNMPTVNSTARPSAIRPQGHCFQCRRRRWFSSASHGSRLTRSARSRASWSPRPVPSGSRAGLPSGPAATRWDHRTAP